MQAFYRKYDNHKYNNHIPSNNLFFCSLIRNFTEEIVKYYFFRVTFTPEDF